MRSILKERREALRLTQKEIARMIGITDRQYQRIESGEQDGTIKVWVKIREITGLPLDDLIDDLSRQDNREKRQKNLPS